MENINPNLPYIKTDMNGTAGERTVNDSAKESGVNPLEQKGGSYPRFVRKTREERAKEGSVTENPLSGISAKEIVDEINRKYWTSRGYVEVPSTILRNCKTWKYVGK